MITITIPESNWFDEKNSEFVSVKETTVNMEFSLISVSKWEMHYLKPYLKEKKPTLEEQLYLFYCMVINPGNIDPRIFYAITEKDFIRVHEYINHPMSATKIQNHKKEKAGSKEMTSEEIYCAMSMLHIPYECQKWHLNRLLKLIEVCAIRNAPPEKMSKKDMAAEWKRTNARNRAKFKSKG